MSKISTSATRRPETPASNGLIGDTIFLDRNGNNSADDGEGIEGVTVNLYDSRRDDAVRDDGHG